jgi:hypothetical protein
VILEGPRVSKDSNSRLAEKRPVRARTKGRCQAEVYKSHRSISAQSLLAASVGFRSFLSFLRMGKSGSIRRKRSHLSLNGSRPSSFIGRNVKVGAAKRPDPEFIENGVLGTGQAEII